MVINQIKFADWFKSNKPSILSDFYEYLSMKTISPNEYIAYDFLQRKFEELGFQTWKEKILAEAITHYEHCPYPMSKITTDNYNFKSFYDVGSKNTLLVSCHIDVVPPCKDAKSTFTPLLEFDESDSEVVYARGACDTKGNLIMFLTALRFLKDNKIPLEFNIEFDGVVEEETGGVGALSTSLLKSKDEYNDIYGVVVLEPTSLKVYKGHRGCLGVSISIIGESTHMGASNSISPVEAIGHLVKALNDLEQEFIYVAKQDDTYRNVDRPIQINIGKISGGEWHGSTMRECCLSVNVGFPHNYSLKLVEERLGKMMKEMEGSTNFKYILELDGIRNEAYTDDNNNEFYNNFLNKINGDASKDNNIDAWQVSCDARLYANHMRVPTLIFGCGDLKDAHSSEEKLRIAELEKAAYIFAKYLSNSK